MAESPFVCGANLTVPIMNLETGEHILDEDGKIQYEQRVKGDPIPEAVHYRKLAKLVSTGRVLLREDFRAGRRRPRRRRLYSRYREVMSAVARMERDEAARLAAAEVVTAPDVEVSPEPVPVEVKVKAEEPEAKPEKKRTRPRSRKEARRAAAAAAGAEDDSSGGTSSAPADGE